MNILFTGNLSNLTDQIAQPLLNGRHRVAYASGRMNVKLLGRKITQFHISPSSADFDKIFHSHHFDIAVFFSQDIYRKEPDYTEYQEFENLLKICADHKINQVIYLQPKHCGMKNGRMPEHDLVMLFEALDRLCDFYRNSKGMSVTKCSIPSVYGYGESASVIGDAIVQARFSGRVHFYGAEDQCCGFLSERDLGEILLRICESGTPACDAFDIPAADICTFSELGKLLKKQFPNVKVSYTSCPVMADTVFDERTVKKEYDWIPLIGLKSEIDELVKKSNEKVRVQKPGLRFKSRLSNHSFLFKLVELVGGFFVMELLLKVTSTMVQFNNIDFRLLYIVILGTIHGMKTGLAASALAGISLFSAFVTNHSKWDAVLFDIDTWLPYVFFFLAGAVTGYVKDRLINDNTDLKNEIAALKEKYATLHELYVSALGNKEQYRTQIMSYKDSFGRFFEITKKLDSNSVDRIFLEALHALEDVLDNHSVCIYRCEEGMPYAHLAVCSKEICSMTEKTLDFSKLEKMLPELRDENVWVNRERLAGYPEYAIELYHDKNPIVLITLEKASHGQFSAYYVNLMKVIGGLIGISLVRAMEYNLKTEAERYLPGSRALRNRYFAELVKIKEEMAGSGNFEYVLLQIGTVPENRGAIADEISSFVRDTDELGLGKNGELYLCLNQTDVQNTSYVRECLKKHGLHYRTVNTDEQEGEL